MIFAILIFVFRCSLFLITQTLFTYSVELEDETFYLLIILSFCLIIILVIVIIVDRKKGLKLFVFYYSERSSLENILMIMFCFYMTEYFGLMLTPGFLKVAI